MPLPEPRRPCTTHPETSTGRRAAMILCAACLALALGCGKRGGNAEPADEQADATLTPVELLKDPAQYDGKWVIVVARVPRVNRIVGGDGRERAEVQLGGNRRTSGIIAEFDTEEWPKTPNFEDGVTYKVRGLFRYSRSSGARFTQCRVVGTAEVEEARPEATLSAENLGAESARYQGKLVQVKAVIRWGFPGADGGCVTLDAPGKEVHTCWLNPGEFEKLRAAGREAEVELKGVVTGPGASVTLKECAVVRVTPAPQPVGVRQFAREFIENPDAAHEKYQIKNSFRNKLVRVTGKVQSVEDGKITFETVRFTAKKPAPTNVIAIFVPHWSAYVSKVKPGDEVTLCGDYREYREGEVELNDCWLMRP